MKENDVKKFGLYNVKDDYFNTFNNKYFSDNKQEKRPFYCSFIDCKGTIWLIPLSTQVANYKEKIIKDEKKHGKGKCLFYHIGKVAGKDRVFLIGNMLPISTIYIKKEFQINRRHYIVSQNSLKSAIQQKSSKYLKLTRLGKLKPNIDILQIEKELLSNKK